MGYKTILVEKILDENIDKKIERKINRHLKMMNHINGMKIAGDNLVSFHRSMFFAQRLLDGVLNHFAERWWGTKTVSMFKMGYEIFSN